MFMVLPVLCIVLTWALYRVVLPVKYPTLARLFCPVVLQVLCPVLTRLRCVVVPQPQCSMLTWILYFFNSCILIYWVQCEVIFFLYSSLCAKVSSVRVLCVLLTVSLYPMLPWLRCVVVSRVLYLMVAWLRCVVDGVATVCCGRCGYGVLWTVCYHNH